MSLIKRMRVHRYLHSFPTRRSSDLNARSQRSIRSAWMPPSAWLCTRTAFVDSFCVRTHKDSDQAVSAQIRVGDVLLYHALRVEKRAVDGDGVLHHFEEPVPLAVVQRQDDAL